MQESLPESMYVFPVDADATLPADWASFAVQPTDPLSVDPAEIAENREAWLQEWTDVTDPVRRYLTLVGLALGPVLVLAVFFVLPVAGMIGRGFVVDGRLDLGGVAEVLARPRTHRVLWFTVWSAGLATLLSVRSGCPPPTCCTGCRSPAAGDPGAAAGAVRAADRGRRRRVPAAGGRSGPLASWARRHAGRDHRRARLLQRRGGDPRRRRGLGVARRAPR